MNENNNKNNNKQGFRKKFHHHKKWNKKNQTPKDLNEVEETEIAEEVEVSENENFVEEVENDVVEETVVEKQEGTEEFVAPKKVVKDVEDDKEDFNKPEENDDYFIKIDWPLHDSMKKELTPDFHRGCRIKAEEYSVGSNVLRHNQCKLDSFNWLKDYQEVSYQGETLVAEVRFKNDRKDFYSYPSELELIEGELVAVETAIGHDIGIVTMVGSLVDRQRKRKGSTCPVSELKKIYRRARVADVEKFLESTRLEERTLYRSREIALNLKLDMKLNDIE